MILALLGGTGCSTTSGGGPYMTSVIVTAPNREAVAQATAKAFEQEGYTAIVTEGNEMRFDKQGSLMTKAAYGSYGDAGVWHRVKVWLRPLEGKTWRVGCDAFVVRDYGDSFFEEEQQLLKFRSGPYTKILNDIQNHLP